MSDHIRGHYLISTNPDRICLDAVHALLSRAYWSIGIPKGIIARALAGSLPFGIYDTRTTPHTQVGIARIISDKSTFAYLCDVFIHESHRGQGLSKWLMETILAHPELQGLRRFCLLTRDAHGLYEQFGFARTDSPDRVMELRDREVYQRQGRPAGAAPPPAR